MDRLKQAEGKKPPDNVAGRYLMDAMAIQGEMLRNLSRKGLISALELGALLEDIGNRYLDIADAVRQRILDDQKRKPNQPLSSEDETRAAQARKKKRRD